LAPLLNLDAAQTFCFYSKKLYYVYALCYPTGLPFYVGMGNNKRCFQHLNESKVWQASARWNEKNDVIYQLLQTNESVWYHFLALVSERLDAAKIEAYWIKKWGMRDRGGMLTNSIQPESTLADCSDTPPPIPGVDENIIIKSFQHPLFVLKPPSGPAPRMGQVIRCYACGKPSQISGPMSGSKCLCSHCGHYVNFTNGEVDDGLNRVQFGKSVLHVDHP
jgi:hypothetical protein